MTARLGVNVPGPTASPAAIAATGATWVRTVYRDNVNWRHWLISLLDLGIECVFVGDSSPESLSDNEGQWPGHMTTARSNYGDLVKTWQWMNEPDGAPDSIASWRMSWQRVNRGLMVARSVFPAGEYTLIAPGMVSGQPDWLKNVRLDLVDWADCHCYAKDANTPQLRDMLNGYLAYGKPLACLEYDSRAVGLTAYLRDFPGIVAASVMAWDDGMTESTEGIRLGLLQNPAAMADFVAATGGPVVAGSPVERHAEFVLGFKSFFEAAPTLVGAPLENERGGVPGFSQQRTARGILTAADISTRGWTLLFWESDTGRRYLFDDGAVEQIA